MKHLKGISPLIASVLLVAFVIAIGAVVVAWITGFTQEQTGTFSERSDRQAKCALSSLSINKNDVRIGNVNLNVTVTYASGSEKLNITGFSVRDSSGVTYTNSTELSVYSDATNMNPGTVRKFVVVLSGAVGAWDEVRVTGLCQNEFAIVGSVKA